MKVSFVEHSDPLHAGRRRQLLIRVFSSSSTFIDLNSNFKINLILLFFSYAFLRSIDLVCFVLVFSICFFICDILMLT